jgi:hypothetical protein
MFVLSLIREGPDATRHVVTAIESRTGGVLWWFEHQKVERSGMLVMDPGGSYVGSDPVPSPGKQPFVLLSLANGGRVPTKPWFALPSIPQAMGPGARILACTDDVIPLSPSLRLHLGESENTILRLGIDGGIHQYTATFDQEGRRIAWGQADGIVCVCDLDEVFRRLKEARLE